MPGATITRYCSPSVQTTRMAFHAIKAGEREVFISAGVETASRFAKGTSDHLADRGDRKTDLQREVATGDRMTIPPTENQSQELL